MVLASVSEKQGAYNKYTPGFNMRTTYYGGNCQAASKFSTTAINCWREVCPRVVYNIQVGDRKKQKFGKEISMISLLPEAKHE